MNYEISLAHEIAIIIAEVVSANNYVETTPHAMCCGEDYVFGDEGATAEVAAAVLEGDGV